MKIYVHGRDFLGWAIDEDNAKTTEILKDIFPQAQVLKIKGKFNKLRKFENLYKILTADIIHSVYYEQLIKIPKFLLKNKNIIACVSNEYKKEKKIFEKLSNIVSGWILYSQNDTRKARESGLNAYCNHIYSRKEQCYKIDSSKEEICNQLGMDYNIIKDKFVISSFQKDSLGSDPNLPKPQKGPDILLDIILKIKNKDKILVLLAGPMRNYIINNLEKNNINYYYYGENKEGLGSSQNKDTINKLYNVTDCYVVSSRSEGGPNAICECMLSKTNIISTRVGASEDFLSEESLYESSEKAAGMIEKFIEEKDAGENLIRRNYDKVNELNSFDAQKERMLKIYKDVFDIGG